MSGEFYRWIVNTAGLIRDHQLAVSCPTRAADVGSVGPRHAASGWLCGTSRVRMSHLLQQADDEGGNGGTLGRSGMPSFPGSGDMMTEMAQKLKQRRIKAEVRCSVCNLPTEVGFRIFCRIMKNMRGVC